MSGISISLTHADEWPIPCSKTSNRRSDGGDLVNVPPNDTWHVATNPRLATNSHVDTHWRDAIIFPGPGGFRRRKPDGFAGVTRFSWSDHDSSSRGTPRGCSIEPVRRSVGGCFGIVNNAPADHRHTPSLLTLLWPAAHADVNRRGLGRTRVSMTWRCCQWT